MSSNDQDDSRHPRDKRTTRPSRRRFLTSGAAAGAASLAGLAQAGPQAAQGPARVRWNREVDVVVIGAGASGLPAAIAARDRGASVLLVEQHFDIGGIAIMSGGNLTLGGGNRVQKKKGIEDSPDAVFADWTRPDRNTTKFNDTDLVRKFADESVATYEFLDANGVEWEAVPVLPPANQRSRRGEADGETAPAAESLPRVATVVRHLQSKEWPNRSEIIAPDQGRNGSGLVRALERSARKKGVEILLSHKMIDLIKEGTKPGRVVGTTLVQVDKSFNHTNHTLNVRARKGIILCCGGHGNNVELRRIFDPRLTAEYHWHGQVVAPANGDGARLAMGLGASLWATANQTAEAGAAFDKGRLGTQDNYTRGRISPESPVFFRARATGQNVADWQDVILVKENARRFYNELDSTYAGYFAHAMAWSGDPAKLNGGGPIWAIFDSAAVKREKWSTEPPFVDREGGYFFSGDTLEEVASQLQRNPHQWRPMPGRVLRETVERFNSFVDTGVDLDFKRRRPPYKIETPPFYAAWATPCLHDSLTGIRINTKCQVLDIHGQVIPGLYSAGEAAGGFALHGLARCTTFGRIAGMEAAKD